MSAALLLASLYALGYVVTLLVMCRVFANGKPLDAGDVGGAMFFAACWPALAPFALLLWLTCRLLPLLGVEVKR